MDKEAQMVGSVMDKESVKRALKISDRTVTEWARKGWLKYKTIQQGSRRFRLYDEAAVEQVRKNGPPRRASADPERVPETQISQPVQLRSLTQPPRPPAPPRSTFSFAAPEGKVTVSLPAGLKEDSRSDVLAFLELVTRQVGRRTIQASSAEE